MKHSPLSEMQKQIVWLYYRMIVRWLQFRDAKFGMRNAGNRQEKFLESALMMKVGRAWQS